MRVDDGASWALQLRSHFKVAKMRLILCFAVAGMRSWFLALVVVAAWCGTAVAQEDKKTDDDKPADPDTGESTIEEKTLGLLPNPLQKYGIKFAATYIGETLGNISGGIKRGAVYEGRLNLAVDVDLQKLVGADQFTFHANIFQIHGGGFSRGSLQNLFVVSGIEALPTTRLYEAYFEKQWGNKAGFAEGSASSPPTASSSIQNTRMCSRTHRWDGQPSPRSTFQRRPFAATGGYGSPRAGQRDGTAIRFRRHLRR